MEWAKDDSFMAVEPYNTTIPALYYIVAIYSKGLTNADHLTSLPITLTDYSQLPGEQPISINSH